MTHSTLRSVKRFSLKVLLCFEAIVNRQTTRTIHNQLNNAANNRKGLEKVELFEVENVGFRAF